MIFRALSVVVGVVALTPFAFAIACGSPHPQEAESAPPTSTSASASSSASASASASASPSASASSPASARPYVDASPELVIVDGLCKEMNEANRFLRTHRTCASDAECEVVMPNCGCAVGVQKSAAAEAKRRHDDAFAKCARKAPMPCATCGPAPTARCAAGLCRP